jgi:hypothetical protein
VALDVVAIPEQANLRLVGDGIPLKAGDTRLYRAAKPWADFKAVGEGAIGEHGRTFLAGSPEAGEKYFSLRLKFSQLLPILGKAHETRQITLARR